MFPIGFNYGNTNLISNDTNQYGVYYSEPDAGLWVCQRVLATNAIFRHKMAGAEATALGLPMLQVDPTGDSSYDTHRYSSIALMGDGHLYIAGMMHDNLLRMVKTTSAGNINAWSSATTALPSCGDDCTYPTFMHRPDGSVRMYLRTGVGSAHNFSGAGDSYFWTTSPTGSTWGGRTMIFKGCSVANAKGLGLIGDPAEDPSTHLPTDTDFNWSCYPSPPFVEDLGGGKWIEHWFWVWRQGASTVPDDTLPSYMQYRSVTNTWHTADGTQVTLPVDPINTLSVQTGLVHDVGQPAYTNQGGICVDENHRPYIVMGRNPFYLVRWTGTAWTQTRLGVNGAIVPGPSSRYVNSPVFPYLFKGAMSWLCSGSAAFGGQDQPMLVRADGSSHAYLGPAVPESETAGHIGPFSGERYAGFGDPYAMRKRGTMELLIPEGNDPKIHVFGNRVHMKKH